jgi:chromosome segregation ATPase
MHRIMSKKQIKVTLENARYEIADCEFDPELAKENIDICETEVEEARREIQDVIDGAKDGLALLDLNVDDLAQRLDDAIEAAENAESDLRSFATHLKTARVEISMIENAQKTEEEQKRKARKHESQTTRSRRMRAKAGR